MALTMEQIMAAREFHQDGGPGGRPCDSPKGPLRWRRNGKTKTWKRRPDKFSIPIAYGLYSHGYLNEFNSQDGVHASEDCPVLKMKCPVEECVLMFGHAPASYGFPHQTINNTNFKAPVHRKSAHK